MQRKLNSLTDTNIQFVEVLPVEIWNIIISRLDLRSLAGVAQSCRLFCDLMRYNVYPTSTLQQRNPSLYHDFQELQRIVKAKPATLDTVIKAEKKKLKEAQHTANSSWPAIFVLAFVIVYMFAKDIKVYKLSLDTPIIYFIPALFGSFISLALLANRHYQNKAALSQLNIEVTNTTRTQLISKQAAFFQSIKIADACHEARNTSTPARIVRTTS